MPFNDGSHSDKLAAGKHTVVVVNYGFKISTQDVNIEAGKTTDLNVALEAYGDKVAGPWGRVYIRGRIRARQCFRTERRRDILSGHVDEFDNDFWVWKQELLLPPGTHHLTITRAGKELWSGDVKVEAGKKVSINRRKEFAGDLGLVEARRGLDEESAAAAFSCRDRQRDCGGCAGEGHRYQFHGEHQLRPDHEPGMDDDGRSGREL